MRAARDGPKCLTVHLGLLTPSPVPISKLIRGKNYSRLLSFLTLLEDATRCDTDEHDDRKFTHLVMGL